LIAMWFNPNMIKNNTNTKPYAEITSFESLLSYCGEIHFQKQ
ncbi:2-haloalkanoic acid dehalogenase, partial [Bacillus toyonensis]